MIPSLAGPLLRLQPMLPCSPDPGVFIPAAALFFDCSKGVFIPSAVPLTPPEARARAVETVRSRPMGLALGLCGLFFKKNLILFTAVGNSHPLQEIVILP